eukprot:SAG22_NODE_522_length_9503_cov_4.233624_3_plen_73_part_00
MRTVSPYCADQLLLEERSACARAATSTNASVADWLSVPAATPAGAYVLQLRHGCEETVQIWTFCTDLHIESA